MISRGNTVDPEEIARDVQLTLDDFHELPHLRVGDADSAHGVIFGEIPGIGTVAVKPFDTASRAETERRNLIKVGEHGFDALEPLHVAVGGLAVYLITLRRTGLRNLGQMNWNVNVASPDLREVIIPSLEQATTTVADWHGAGIFHGDAQVKNLVYGPDGRSVYVDAEKTQFGPDKSHRATLTAKDLNILGLSVLARGLLQDRSPSFRLGFVNEHIVDHYLRRLAASNIGVDRDKLKDDLRRRWTKALENGQVPKWVSRQSQGK